MIYKFLLLTFFLCICIVASAQELQAPQINQNAIFANPGLAGSKGQTRICTALSAFHANYLSGEGWDSNGNTSQKFRNRNLYSCLVSMDGLILKNKLGIAGYIKNEWHQINDTYNFYQNNTQTNAKYMNYKYTNLLMGFMLAPKFHITSSKENKQDHVLSPAAAIGLKDTRFNYSGENFYNYTTQDSIINGENKNTLNLDYVSASLLYTSPRSYTGIKLNFKNYIHTFLLYNVSFIYAKTYSNKNLKEPKFSFTHQFQLTIPTYEFFKVNRYNSYFDGMNTQQLDNYFNANLDFRYGKFIFGNFIGLNNYADLYAGLTAGVQFENTKIIANYSPKLSTKETGQSALFLSANFQLQSKSKRYP